VKRGLSSRRMTTPAEIRRFISFLFLVCAERHASSQSIYLYSVKDCVYFPISILDVGQYVQYVHETSFTFAYLLSYPGIQNINFLNPLVPHEASS